MSINGARLATSLAFICACTWSVAAQAAGLTASEALRQYNVIVAGNMESSSDMEGRVYVGGDALGSFDIYNHGSSAPASSYPAFYVGGTVSGGEKKVNNAGSAVIKGSILSGKVIANGGQLYVEGSVASGAEAVANGGGTATVGSPSPLPTPDPLGELSELNLRIAALAEGAAAVPFDPAFIGEGKSLPVLSAQGSGITYYNIGIDDFDSWTDRIEYKTLAPDQTVIINIHGDGDASTYEKLRFDLNASGASGDSAPTVLWNIVGIDEVEISVALFGQLLAPQSYVRLTGSPLEGTLVANRLYTTTQVHQRPWTGSLPPPSEQDVVATPVPAALPLLAGGLGAMALVGRRRRRAA